MSTSCPRSSKNRIIDYDHLLLLSGYGSKLESYRAP